MQHSRQLILWRPGYAVMLLASLCGAAAGEPESTPAIDERLLPPAASRKVDYERDIRPILEVSCLKCHGAERPKSGLRLTDRVSALKGGHSGPDIIVGNSAESPLIHYVSRVVEDMEMPPTGKAPPLSAEEVGLLRAWIDQGLNWGSSGGAVQTQSSVELTPAMSWTWVDGNRAKFRELEWQEDGWNGGLERFELSQRFSDGRSVVVEGRVLRDDYRVMLEMRRPELGFARAGFEQFRKWFDDNGGYQKPLTPPGFDPGEDLHLDIGRFWANFGLTLPDWPRVVIGYEYQFKEGDRSMLSWGRVNSAGSPFDARNIFPSAKAIDEHTHVLTLDLRHDFAGFTFEDNARAEFYRLETQRADALLVPAGAVQPTRVAEIDERRDDVLVANVARLTKPVTDWMLLSGGYRYSWLDGEAGFHLETKDGAGQPAAGDAWQSNEILLRQSTHIVNLNSQFRPLPPLTATLGGEAQWLHQESVGDLDLDESVDPNDPTGGLVQFPATVRSHLDKLSVEEAFVPRFTGIPHTVLFGEVRLRQEEFSQHKEQLGGLQAFLLETEATAQSEEYRGGFSVSPWHPIDFTAQYKHRDRKRDYDYPRDELPPGTDLGPGYSGFIRARDLSVDEFEARLVFRPVRWIKSTVAYQWASSEYRTTTGSTSITDVGPNATPGGRVFAGDYQSHGISGSVALNPVPRLYTTASLAYQHAALTTADNGNFSIAPYRGEIYSAWVDLRYALEARTDLFGRWTLSESDFGQHNADDGLPLGLEHNRQVVQAGLVRRIGELASTRIQYGFYRYREPSSGHRNDYTAHQVLLAFTFRWL